MNLNLQPQLYIYLNSRSCEK